MNFMNGWINTDKDGGKVGLKHDLRDFYAKSK
jgi:hypothetical protein